MTEEKSAEESAEEQKTEEAAEETIEQQLVGEEPKPAGLDRIPNREKGSSNKPPFIMMGIFVAFAVLSVILAKLL